MTLSLPAFPPGAALVAAVRESVGDAKPRVTNGEVAQLRRDVAEARKHTKLLLGHSRRTTAALVGVDKSLSRFEETLKRIAEEAEHEHERQQEEDPGYR